ncbi:UDP-forming cellulose synthase catalytic subunit [Halomonas organivorans]|uniref:Cellulose synthase catalytic subunit [UDP-forming] n=1 Tax=Halomonas organivorans TaxID=257772 RepID=A0A7W5G5K9_9GAMM|nr:UDP-forming cellulose synthase catalytic subunit [Halomonas organivorans]MBB3141017.1 cellulose synthase (UDP-forming) [Halomonas organivorans]
MSPLLRRNLMRPLSHHYRALRHKRGAGPLTASLLTLLWLLGWGLLRFESPAWQGLFASHGHAFRHLHRRRPGLADPLRYLIQIVWLAVLRPRRCRPQPAEAARSRAPSWAKQAWGTYREALRALPRHLMPAASRPLQASAEASSWPLLAMGTLAAMLMLLVITQPFSLAAQAVFVALLWGIALIVRRIPGRLATLVLIVLSVTVSCRYLWWRYTSTLNWNDPLDMTCGLLLLGAETYTWLILILGYFQTIWPLNRRPVPLPEDTSRWPTIDLMIPTYHEPLDVVRPTVLAALGIDWPSDKLRIHLLDDGRREALHDFARSVGINYITRDDNRHAKAGNLNHALSVTDGEFLAVFDCDHVPQRSFLQMTLGWFLKEPRLGMLQTPHHFFSPDPFERNLGRFREMPNEGTLFYGLVQDGNDLWDASFFCGSCAVLRRSALEAIGGFAVETVTEDAHTSLRLHRHGYTSAYLRLPQAAGLATESLSAHIGQRIRWARGMVQIFRLDNPLLGRGLSLGQRLCYVNAMLHFLAGIPRLIFLTAPLAFLLLHAYIIYAPAIAILLYVAPHMFHSGMTNSRIQGRYRHSFWSEIYDAVLAWYIARPTTMALINPRKGKFNVTAKGGLVSSRYFDWTISRPYLLLILLNIAGVAAGGWRLYAGPTDEIPTVLVSLGWTLYNLMILGGAVAVAAEARQVRRHHRVQVAQDAAVAREDGHTFPCILNDYAEAGVGLSLPRPGLLEADETVTLLLRRGRQEHAFEARVVNLNGTRAGLALAPMSLPQHIAYIQCTFARADTWTLWRDDIAADRPMQSLRDILGLGLEGYRRLFLHAPASVRGPLGWLGSFLPRRVTITPVGGR